MRTLVSVVLSLMLVLSLFACTGMQKKETVRVKCPACGYEFEAPIKGGN
jgi:hypothetical protein